MPPNNNEPICLNTFTRIELKVIFGYFSFCNVLEFLIDRIQSRHFKLTAILGGGPRLEVSSWTIVLQENEVSTIISNLNLQLPVVGSWKATKAVLVIMSKASGEVLERWKFSIENDSEVECFKIETILYAWKLTTVVIEPRFEQRCLTCCP
ncbi:hypothetical protein K7X08_010058 [Anisodus acutangulus]|uniref:Uncharacterized protein n=1 Tax=Anisodus acutangulus TaxID=402998 RepID=A0A9Q1RU59_9SOLA|nr:hypothetical protein K7X08_010058 [Anisodus acutangulus]